jgi:hypothetical protein
VAALAYRLRVRHEYRADDPDRASVDQQVRLFRKHPAVRFVGRLHPHIDPPIDRTAAAAGLSVLPADGRIRRLAHLSKPTPDKVRWSIRLLEAELRDRPGQLGLEVELGRNYLGVGDARGHDVLAAAAGRVFAATDPPKDAAAVGPLLEYLLTVAPDVNRSGISRDRARAAAKDWYPDVPPVVWTVAGERFAAGDYAAAAVDLNRLLEWGRTGRYPPSGGFDPDILGPTAAMNLAVCYVHLDRLDDARTVIQPLLSHPRWRTDAADVYRTIAARSAKRN